MTAPLDVRDGPAQLRQILRRHAVQGLKPGHRNRHYRLPPMTSYILTFHGKNGPIRTVSEINGDFSRKSHVHTPMYSASQLTRFSLELGIGAGNQKTRMTGLPVETEV